MGPRLLVILFAHHGVRLFGVAHRNVRFLAALSGDRQEHEFLWDVEQTEPLLDVRRMDVGLRAAHVLWGDLLEVLLVGEHAGLLEQLDGIPCIPELGRDIRDQVDEVLADGARVQRELHAARDDVPELPSIVLRELDDVGSAERAERGSGQTAA